MRVPCVIRRSLKKFSDDPKTWKLDCIRNRPV